MKRDRRSVAQAGNTASGPDRRRRGGTPSKSIMNAIEIDRLSFVVRAQKFRIAATVMRRSTVPLATEFALRLVNLVPNLTAEDIAAFFGFGAAEVTVLVQDMFETGLVGEKDGRIVLSTRGMDAISDNIDDLELFGTEEVSMVQSFDLIAFAPADESELTGIEGRLVQEIALPDRERAARGIAAANEAFDFHFQECSLRGSRRRAVDTRLRTIDDVHFIRTFAAPYEVPIRYRPDDAASGMAGVEADFASFRNRGRAGSRDKLIEAFSAVAQNVAAPRDFDEALSRTAEADDGILLEKDLRSPEGQVEWARLCMTEEGRRLSGPSGPGFRLIGSSASASVRAALRIGVAVDPGAERLYVRTPIIWMPPRMALWGRSLEFARSLRDLSDAEPDGTVLLVRDDDRHREAREFTRRFKPRHSQAALFDCGLAVRTTLPDALEVILKPGAWAMAFVHVPDAHGTYPIPFGYLTAAPAILTRWRSVLAEVAASSNGSKGVLWHAPDESAPEALVDIDLALGIGAAD